MSDQHEGAGSMTHVSRRTLLRAGTVAGAVVWTTPVINTIGLGAGSAAAQSGPPGPVDQIPSFGGFLLLIGGKYYAYQVTPGSTTASALGAGNGGPALLAERNGVTVQPSSKNPAVPTAVTVGETTTSDGARVLFVTGVDTSLLAFTHDGSFQHRPDNECLQPHYRDGVAPAGASTATPDEDDEVEDAGSATPTVTTTAEQKPGKKAVEKVCGESAKFRVARSFAGGWIFSKA